MQLVTLGGLRLEPVSFGRPKPLLLVAYLAIEGPKSRRYLSELFWPGAPRPMNNLRVALSQLRRALPEALNAEGSRLEATLEVDARLLLDRLDRGELAPAVETYHGAFLDDVDLSGAGAELEEWVFATREFVAGRVRWASLLLAESDAALNDLANAGRRAQAALQVAGAPPLEPGELQRLHRLLLLARSPLAESLEQEAREFGLELEVDREQALRLLAPDTVRLTAATNNLPIPATEFVGREPELIEIARLLESPEQRLVTLQGPGGVGKSRLALEVARWATQERRFQDGVYFVALESLAFGQQPGSERQTWQGVNPKQPMSGESNTAKSNGKGFGSGDSGSGEFSSASLYRAIAAACGVGLVGSDPASAELTAAFSDKRMLLILDNCEHLPQAGSVALELLQGCPELKILATSRDRLQVPAEQLFAVEGLSIGGAQAGYYDAVQLFLSRAKRVRLEFDPGPLELADIEEICRLVDGYPLAIELAAVWLRILSPKDIAREIRADIDFLASEEHGVPQRHSSLRAAFEHSWRLLDDEERSALRRLAVFEGGFTRGGASRVTGASIPTLAALVDKSLLRVEGPARFGRHPQVRRFSLEKLAQDEAELIATSNEHARWCLEIALPGETFAADQGGHLELLEREHDNLRAALQWTLRNGAGRRLGQRNAEVQGYGGQSEPVREHGGRSEDELREVEVERLRLGIELAVALYRFWYYRTHLAEGRQWLSRAVEIARVLPGGDPSLVSRALHALGVLSGEQGDVDAAVGYLQERVRLARELGDLVGEAASLNSLGALALEEKDYPRAQEFLEKSLELRLAAGRQDLLFGPYLNLGLVALGRNDYTLAQEMFERGLEQAREFGNEMGSATALSNLGSVHLRRGNTAAAREHLEEAARAYLALGNKDGVAHCLEGYAGAAALEGSYREAAKLAGVAASLREESGLPAKRYEDQPHLAPAREALDQHEFEQAYREGYEQGHEEALRERLEH